MSFSYSCSRFPHKFVWYFCSLYRYGYPLLLGYEHGMYEYSFVFMIANPGILSPLPDVSVENGFQVIPIIQYQTADGMIVSSWCRTCHFYKLMLLLVMIHRSPSVHHCSVCNCCVTGFDHHCVYMCFLQCYTRWLNNCIASRNIHYFFWLLFYAFSMFLLIIPRCIGAMLAFLRESRMAYYYFQYSNGMEIVKQNMNWFDAVLSGVVLITFLLYQSRSYVGKTRCIIVISVAVFLFLLHLAIISLQVSFAAFISSVLTYRFS